MVNTSKRNSLKMMGASVATAGYASLVPVKAIAGMLLASDVGQTPALSSNVRLEFVDSKSIDGFKSTGQLTIYNDSEYDLLVSDFAPAVIETDNALYDISVYLKRVPIQVSGGGQRRLWIKPVDQVPAKNRRAGPVTVTRSGEILSSVHLSIKSPRLNQGSSDRPVELALSLA